MTKRKPRHTPQRDEDLSPRSFDAPTTLIQFARRFPTDAACAEFLYQIRWPDGFVCPKCGDTRAYPIKGRPVTECGNGHQTSVTAGTVMHRSRQPLTVWFYAAYLVSTLTPGISALQFQKQLGIKRYETAYNMLHKLRSALVAPGRERLRGEVEIDEGFVGGVEKGRPGRGSSRKALVVVAVEIRRWIAPDPEDPDNPDVGIERVRAGRIRMAVIPDAKAETLIPWVQSNVEEGSLVRTDGWGAYGGKKGEQLGLSALGYQHEPVMQSHKGVSTGRWLPMVHLIISNLKRWLMGTHKGAVRKKHLQAYLNEFVFRFNRRFWRGPAFVRALGLATHADTRPEYETLYDGEWAHPNPKSDDLPALTVDALFAVLEDQATPDLREWMHGNQSRVRAQIRETLQSAGYGVSEGS